MLKVCHLFDLVLSLSCQLKPKYEKTDRHSTIGHLSDLEYSLSIIVG